MTSVGVSVTMYVPVYVHSYANTCSNRGHFNTLGQGMYYKHRYLSTMAVLIKTKQPTTELRAYLGKQLVS